MASSPRNLITKIDRAINENRRARENGPERHRRECTLFRRRGVAQLHQAIADEAAAARLARRPLKTAKCPTCGAATFAESPAS